MKHTEEEEFTAGVAKMAFDDSGGCQQQRYKKSNVRVAVLGDCAEALVHWGLGNRIHPP